MKRLAGLEKREAGWFARFAYWWCARKLGRVIESVKIYAHHPRLLRAVGEMEFGQEAARQVAEPLKVLAQLRVARMIGCPF